MTNTDDLMALGYSNGYGKRARNYKNEELNNYYSTKTDNPIYCISIFIGFIWIMYYIISLI